MTRRTRQVYLSIVVLLCAEMLAVILLDRDVLRDPRPPESMEGKAAWLAEHPADWLTASTLADVALDSESPHRFELWRAAYAHAKHLAPYRRNPDAAFLRAGLFHWYELPPRDRAAVLQAAAPLMREPDFFSRMSGPLLQLTHDFAWIRRHAPATTGARNTLLDLTLQHGLFADYRSMREELRGERMRRFTERRRDADSDALLELIPARMDAGDEPLAKGILEEIDQKPFDAERMRAQIEILVDYAVRHDLQPQDGLRPLLDTPSRLNDITRARVALDLNDAALATRIETSVPVTPQWEPYFLDRALFEARRRDAAAANAYLVRAAVNGMSTRVLATAEEVARTLGRAQDAATYRTQLLARSKEPRVWNAVCGANELCTSAWIDAWLPNGTMRIDAATVQSDETPPYVELYVDDLLTAEGEVSGPRTFEIHARPGLHRIEARLVNPRMGNGTQRRVRLS